MRTPQEAHVVREIFAEEQYRVESAEPLHIWDVGANVGFASVYFAGALGCSVTAFELFPHLAERARANLEANGLSDRATVHAVGIGEPGELELDFYPVSAASNGLFGNFAPDRAGQAERVRVRVTSVESALETLRRESEGKALFAKIDCEGAEYAIFRRLEELGETRAFAGFVVELHEVPGADPEGLAASLTRQGFLVHRRQAFHQSTSMLWASRRG